MLTDGEVKSVSDAGRLILVEPTDWRGMTGEFCTS
jgi:hypothetical protein